mgnify:FL=1
METERKVVPINDRVIQVGVFQVDLAKLTPLTLGDQETLLKEPYNVDFNKAATKDGTPADNVNLVWFILRKVESQVTREATATLSVKVSAAIVTYFTRLSSEVDIPLGLLPPPSTSSRGTTAGVSKT